MQEKIGREAIIKQNEIVSGFNHKQKPMEHCKILANLQLHNP